MMLRHLPVHLRIVLWALLFSLKTVALSIPVLLRPTPMILFNKIRDSSFKITWMMVIKINKVVACVIGVIEHQHLRFASTSVLRGKLNRSWSSRRSSISSTHSNLLNSSFLSVDNKFFWVYFSTVESKNTEMMGSDDPFKKWWNFLSSRFVVFHHTEKDMSKILKWSAIEETLLSEWESTELPEISSTKLLSSNRWSPSISLPMGWSHICANRC